MRTLAAILLMFCAMVDAAEPLRVIATTSVLRDLARNIGGEHVEVGSLMPAGVDPHAFQPSPTDVAMIANADVVITNGLGLDQWLDTLVKQSGFNGRIIVASEGVETITPDDSKETDPHAWLDVRNAMKFCDNIRTGLAQVRPEAAADVQALANLYAAQLRVLDAWIKRELSVLPTERRRLVVTHGSLEYFARAYDLDAIAVEGAADERAPSAEQLADLIALIKSERIAAIFTERNHNDKLCRQIAQDTGIVAGGNLITDGLAADGQPGDSYIGMMALNVRAIRRLLP